ncbi:hypothetical protein J2Z49_001899, partial [Desulfofundulus luciae]|nr:hypothetical protein [Desulfofundulus luciae]
FVSSGGSMLVIFVLQWVNFICTKWVNSIDNQHLIPDNNSFVGKYVIMYRKGKTLDLKFA